VSPRAFVTGATGMLGSYLVQQLLEGGWSVRAMVRDRRAAQWLADMGAEPVTGALADRATLAAAAHSCT